MCTSCLNEGWAAYTLPAICAPPTGCHGQCRTPQLLAAMRPILPNLPGQWPRSGKPVTGKVAWARGP
eukprot:10260033-Lingulodinium_polyedra.AAC.1